MSGYIVELEGTDGTGKSTVAGSLASELGGTVFSRITADADTSLDRLTRSVGTFFGESLDDVPALEVLALAAITQDAAILESQVLPHVRAGGVAVLDSWWLKTSCRFVIEAENLGYEQSRIRRIAGWIDDLAYWRTWPDLTVYTAVLELDDSTVRARYEQLPEERRDIVIGRDGRNSVDPDEFVDFVSRIRHLIRKKSEGIDTSRTFMNTTDDHGISCSNAIAEWIRLAQNTDGSGASGH
ncbi:hypothetical protein [Microbacterium maritypicum]|uniref:hypothetical protein n=1 Tax=Microbacterium maritypicum TaxID=33918 RepID=UPI003808AE7C